MKDWAAMVTKAKSLDMLHHALIEAGNAGVRLHPEAEDPRCRVDLASLPKFGGIAPSTGSFPVWSWDMRCMLIGETLSELRIVPRRVHGLQAAR